MPKILYVEDEPFLAKIVKESLESRDYEVVLVEDGEQAISEYERSAPEICVLDVMLPGKNGFDIARDIRQRDPQVPILFLTAKSQTDDLLQGFQSGGNDYIKKPFSMEELIVRIENLLALTSGARSTEMEADEIAIGDTFRFFPRKMQLQFGEEVRQLSHKESQILHLLCQHRHDRLERKKLLLEVWQDDSYFNSRNLDVYIRKLRKYLSRDERVQIITLKGIGYRFEVG